MQLEPPHAIEGATEHGARIDEDVVGALRAAPRQGGNVGKTGLTGQYCPASFVRGEDPAIASRGRNGRVVHPLLPGDRLHVHAGHVVRLHGVLDVDLPVAGEVILPATHAGHRVETVGRGDFRKISQECRQIDGVRIEVDEHESGPGLEAAPASSRNRPDRSPACRASPARARAARPVHSSNCGRDSEDSSHSPRHS